VRTVAAVVARGRGRGRASHGRLGPFTAEEVATLISSAFIGAQALLLLGLDRRVMAIRAALRRIGVVIKQLEEEPRAPGRTEDAGMPAGL
jgi:hypothetical protein